MFEICNKRVRCIFYLIFILFYNNNNIIVNKQLTQEGEPGILEFLTSPAGIITMSSIVGAAIGVIVVIKKKVFYKSTDKEIKRTDQIIQDEE